MCAALQTHKTELGGGTRLQESLQVVSRRVVDFVMSTRIAIPPTRRNDRGSIGEGEIEDKSLDRPLTRPLSLGANQIGSHVSALITSKCQAVDVESKCS